MKARNRTRKLPCSILLVGSLFAGGCEAQKSSQTVGGTNTAIGERSTTNRQVYTVKGVIQEVKANENTLIIKHEEIPGYMAAMTMPLEVRNTNEMAGLEAGDEIRFNMVVTDDDGWIEAIKKTGVTNAPGERPSVRLVREVEPLEEGMKLPDYTLTNSLGNTIKFSDFKGQALVFTFIFTRCPFPLFCPKMNENLEKAHDLLLADQSSPTNWHLISISFDPTFDTPARLKAYSDRYAPNPAKWDFATGALVDIDALTEQFGLEIAYQAGNFDHKLRTVVVDAAGTIQEIFIGNQWTAEELLTSIKKAAQSN